MQHEHTSMQQVCAERGDGRVKVIWGVPEAARYNTNIQRAGGWVAEEQRVHGRCLLNARVEEAGGARVCARHIARPVPRSSRAVCIAVCTLRVALGAVQDRSDVVQRVPTIATGQCHAGGAVHASASMPLSTGTFPMIGSTSRRSHSTPTAAAPPATPSVSL